VVTTAVATCTGQPASDGSFKTRLLILVFNHCVVHSSSRFEPQSDFTYSIQ
jgi:hypothetical protein